MAYSDYVKSQIKHHRCVVCGRTFGAQYDPFIRSFPVFHPYAGRKHVMNCEDIFFKEVLRIYRYLYESGESKSMRKVLDEFSWNSHIAMRREMLEWCMRQGYFNLNNLKRLQVPPAIEDACKELFAKADLNDPASIQSAIELIKAALRCFSDDLEKLSDDDLPIQSRSVEQGVSTLYDRIDTSKVELRSERGGMVTSDQSGASEIDKRMRSASITLERRRLGE